MTGRIEFNEAMRQTNDRSARVAVNIGIAAGVLIGHFVGWWTVISPLLLIAWHLHKTRSVIRRFERQCSAEADDYRRWSAELGEGDR